MGPPTGTASRSEAAARSFQRTGQGVSVLHQRVQCVARNRQLQRIGAEDCAAATGRQRPVMPGPAGTLRSHTATWGCNVTFVAATVADAAVSPGEVTSTRMPAGTLACLHDAHAKARECFPRGTNIRLVICWIAIAHADQLSRTGDVEGHLLIGDR